MVEEKRYIVSGEELNEIKGLHAGVRTDIWINKIKSKKPVSPLNMKELEKIFNSPLMNDYKGECNITLLDKLEKKIIDAILSLIPQPIEPSDDAIKIVAKDLELVFGGPDGPLMNWNKIAESIFIKLNIPQQKTLDRKMLAKMIYTALEKRTKCIEIDDMPEIVFTKSLPLTDTSLEVADAILKELSTLAPKAQGKE